MRSDTHEQEIKPDSTKQHLQAKEEKKEHSRPKIRAA